MKIRKSYGLLLVVIVLAVISLSYFFRPITMNNIYSEPHFGGVVSEVYEHSILVSINEEEGAYKNSDIISVSLDVKLKDSMTHFNIGDEVSVYYNGEMLESYPAQVNTVYAIILTKSQ